MPYLLRFVLYTLLLVFATPAGKLFAQVTKDSSFAFQSDAAKRYSLYIPSSYKAGTPAKLMLGLHPLNPARWNAKSWRDTLLAFAETNNLVLVCPDGGNDGRIDDPIDTAFTSALLDSVMTWYSINKNKVFVMGFSWGGRTTYSYGLSHSATFAGFLPIGAAIDGADEFAALLPNAANKPFYLLHGGNDAPEQGFLPIKAALEEAGARVNSKLLAGVGHTIDFPNRNALLTEAFRWLDSTSSTQTVGVAEPDARVQWSVFPNPSTETVAIQFKPTTAGHAEIAVADMYGRTVRVVSRGYAEPHHSTVFWDGTDEYGTPVALGLYMVVIRMDNKLVASLSVLKQ